MEFLLKLLAALVVDRIDGVNNRVKVLPEMVFTHPELDANCNMWVRFVLKVVYYDQFEDLECPVGWTGRIKFDFQHVPVFVVESYDDPKRWFGGSGVEIMVWQNYEAIQAINKIAECVGEKLMEV